MMLIIRVIFVLIGLFCLNPAMGEEKDAMPKSDIPKRDFRWTYPESFIHTHMSTGVSGQELDRIQAQIEVVRPDVIEFHSGHGWAARNAAELGFHHAMTINHAGTWKRGYDDDPAYVHRVNPDGSRAGRQREGEIRKHLCFNAPAIDRDIVPFYRNSAEKYRPSQIWIDENIITVNYCYCDYCTPLFEKEYGMTPPVEADDPGWDEWQRFHRDVFLRWMKKINDAVASVDPGILVTFNHTYFVDQPEPLPEFLHNLSADIHHSPLHIGFYARYGAGQRIPFDIMPGLCNDRWAGKSPKSREEMLVDVAIINANGGRWNIGEYPATSRQPHEALHALAVEGAAFARARQPWTHKSVSEPVAAILHSASTHYARSIPSYAEHLPLRTNVILNTDGMLERVALDSPAIGKTRIYWPFNRPMADELVGAYLAMLENQVHMDVIHEQTLHARTDDYALLVVPEQFRLDEATIGSIAELAAAGGHVIATGSTAITGLADVLGCAPGAHRVVESVSTEWAGQALNTLSFYQVEPRTASVLARFDNEAKSPAIITRKVGKGRVTYLSFDLFGQYAEESPYAWWGEKHRSEAYRTIAAAMFSEAVAELDIRFETPPWVEVSIHRNHGRQLVHLVDRSREWKDAPEAAGPIVIHFGKGKRLKEVWLQPDNEALALQETPAGWSVELPMEKLDIHAILELRPQ